MTRIKSGTFTWSDLEIIMPEREAHWDERATAQFICRYDLSTTACITGPAGPSHDLDYPPLGLWSIHSTDRKSVTHHIHWFDLIELAKETMRLDDRFRWSSPPSDGFCITGGTQNLYVYPADDDRALSNRETFIQGRGKHSRQDCLAPFSAYVNLFAEITELSYRITTKVPDQSITDVVETIRNVQKSSPFHKTELVPEGVAKTLEQWKKMGERRSER